MWFGSIYLYKKRCTLRRRMTLAGSQRKRRNISYRQEYLSIWLLLESTHRRDKENGASLPFSSLLSSISSPLMASSKRPTVQGPDGAVLVWIIYTNDAIASHFKSAATEDTTLPEQTNATWLCKRKLSLSFLSLVLQSLNISEYKLSEKSLSLSVFVKWHVIQHYFHLQKNVNFLDLNPVVNSWTEVEMITLVSSCKVLTSLPTDQFYFRLAKGEGAHSHSFFARVSLTSVL